MDKINFVNGCIPSAEDFNKIQDSAEKAGNSIAKNIIGDSCIVSGFRFNIIGTQLIISPGVGFDYDGQALHTQNDLTFDLSQISRPNAGLKKYLTFYVEYTRSAHGDIFNDINQRFDYYLNDSVNLKLMESAETINPIPPDVNTGIILIDYLLDDQYDFLITKFDLSRRQGLLKLSAVLNEIIKINKSLTSYIVDLSSTVSIELTATTMPAINNSVIRNFLIKYPITGFLQYGFTSQNSGLAGFKCRLSIFKDTSSRYTMIEREYTSVNINTDNCIPVQLNPGKYQLQLINNSTTSSTPSYFPANCRLYIKGAFLAENLISTFEIVS